MTREEAINVLENIRINAGYYFHADAKDNYACALEMAIEALSKRDNAEPIPQWRGCVDGCLPYYDGKEVQDEQIH